MNIANGRDNGFVPQDPYSAGSLSQAYESMVHCHNFLDWLQGYRKWERPWLRTARSTQRWFVITNLQIYGTLSRLLRLTAWILQMGKTMVLYRKIHAALVHYHKHTNLWDIITTSCSTGSLLQAYKSMVRYLDFLDWPHGYRKWERSRLRTARSMQRWFLITSIQRYGRVARNPKNTGPWSQVYEGHGHLALDPHNVGTLL
jgi:hypothetical protein